MLILRDVKSSGNWKRDLSSASAVIMWLAFYSKRAIRCKGRLRRMTSHRITSRVHRLQDFSSFDLSWPVWSDACMSSLEDKVVSASSKQSTWLDGTCAVLQRANSSEKTRVSGFTKSMQVGLDACYLHLAESCMTKS